jgi:hypothetical protein
MKRGTSLSLCSLATLAAVLTGCSNSTDSSSALAANEAMTVPPAPARQRGLMFASDGLGRAVFSDSTPAMASVPERD